MSVGNGAHSNGGSSTGVSADFDGAPLSLFEALWSGEAAPGCDPLAQLFLDLAPDNQVTRQRRLQRLEANLAEIVSNWRHEEEKNAKKDSGAIGGGGTVAAAATTTAAAAASLASNKYPSAKTPVVISLSSSSNLFHFCLVSLHRLSLTCPFADVASFCRRQLKSFVAAAPKSVLDAAAASSSKNSFTVASIVESFESVPESDCLVTSSKSSSSSSSSSFPVFSHVASTCSVFIPSSELPPLPNDSSDPDSDSSSSSSFHFRFSSGVGGGASAGGAASLSRVDNLFRLLATHPSYSEAFFRTEEELMAVRNNPLAADQARFLAVLSAAHQNCSPSVFLESQKFLLCGGDPRWLKVGLRIPSSTDNVGDDGVNQSTPFFRAVKLDKLRSMAQFNQLLLHRPWAINASHVASLVKPNPSDGSPAAKTTTSCWTVPEVVHAVAILAHFHGVACIIHGCGVAPEIDDVLDGGGGGGGGRRSGDGGSRCSSLAFAVEEDIDNVGEVIDKMKSIDLLTGPEMDADQKARVFQRLADEESEIVVESEPGLADGESDGGGEKRDGEAVAVEEGRVATLLKLPNVEEDASRPTSISTSAEASADGSLFPSVHSIDAASAVPNLHLLSVPTTTLSPLLPTTLKESKFARFLGGAGLRFIDFSSSRNRVMAAETSASTTCLSASSLTPVSTPQPSPPKKSPISGSSKKTFKPYNKYEPLRLDEFSWQDHGYSIMSRFCEFSSLFDDKFDVTKNLTYFTMGHRDDIDTTTFRVAVWNYVQLIYGIRHDDYDYRELSIMLDLPLRKFIKAVSCYPDRVTKDLFDCCMTNFKPSEKIHVTLMIAEAKLQAQLLYALRAVDEYLK